MTSHCIYLQRPENPRIKDDLYCGWCLQLKGKERKMREVKHVHMVYKKPKIRLGAIIGEEIKVLNCYQNKEGSNKIY